MFTQSKLSYTTAPSVNKNELVEFRNYVRKTAQSKIDGSQDNERKIAKTFHLDSKPLSVMNQSPVKNKYFQPQNDNSQHHHLTQLSDWKKFNRSTSQSFVTFDANTWKEDQNSMRQKKIQTPSVNASDLIKVNRTLSSLSNKEIQGLSGQYVHSIQELEHAVSSINYSQSPLYQSSQTNPKSETSSSKGHKFLQLFSLCCTREELDQTQPRNIIGKGKPRSQTMKNVDDIISNKESQIRKYSETCQVNQNEEIVSQLQLKWINGLPIPILLIKNSNKIEKSLQQFNQDQDMTYFIMNQPYIQKAQNICLFTQRLPTHIISLMKNKNQITIFLDKEKESKKVQECQSELIKKSKEVYENKQNFNDQLKIKIDHNPFEIIKGTCKLKSFNFFDNVLIIPKSSNNQNYSQNIEKYIVEILSQFQSFDQLEKVSIFIPTNQQNIDIILYTFWQKMIAFYQPNNNLQQFSMSFDNQFYFNSKYFYLTIQIKQFNNVEYALIDFQNQQYIQQLYQLLLNNIYLENQFNLIINQQDKEEMIELLKSHSYIQCLQCIKQLNESKIQLENIKEHNNLVKYIKILQQQKLDFQIIQQYFNIDLKYDEQQQEDQAIFLKYKKKHSQTIDLDRYEDLIDQNYDIQSQFPNTIQYSFPINE